MDPPQTLRNSSTQRIAFFNKLKPCCLEIVKTLRKGANSPQDAAASASTLVGLTETLYGVLTEQVGYDASVLDTSMADCASFPLLSVFQNLHNYPARLVENATKCMRVLIQYGWKTSISKENAQQFLLLLTSVVTGGRVPGRKNTRGSEEAGSLPEETVTEGYRALAALMRAAGAVSSGTGSPLTTANAVPTLAHAVTVMLEGVTDFLIPTIQLEALGAIEAFYSTIKESEALASFFPGTVSALVRLFAMPGSYKTPKRVVVRTLEVLFVVLVNTLGDMQTRRLHIPRQDDKKSGAAEIENDASPSSERTASFAASKLKLDAAWLKGTAAQVKLALATVLKLRNHESEEVRDAVQQFCIGLLDECHTSLAECTPILVESAIVTTQSGDEVEAPAGLQTLGLQPLGATDLTRFQSFGPRTTLQDLAILYPELSDIIKSTTYNWATSLPRIMQSSDEDRKTRAFQNLQKAIAILEALHIDSTTLQDTLAAALRDSVVTLVLTSAAPKAVVHEADGESSLLQGEGALNLLKPESQASSLQLYRPVLLSLGSQTGTREAVLNLIANVGSASQQVRLAGDMLEFARDAEGLDQVAAFWLSFELVKASFSQSMELDSLLELSAFDSGNESDTVFEDLYSFSVSTLASHSDIADGDWRLDAIALEVTAFSASRLKESFRPELIDVLYPVATYLGSPEGQLRFHAITTLNSLAGYCGYGSVSELIISNVDYMLNSVSLRLNTFDISPSSTKVLTMMIRLAGPRLVPYLDDVVASIFAALDNYHGYPLFVENLFAVLGEVVQQTVKSTTLLLEDGQESPHHHLKRRLEPSATEDLVDLLERRAKRRKETDDEEYRYSQSSKRDGHPKRPWKSEAHELLHKHEISTKGKGDNEDGDDNNNHEQDTGPDKDPSDGNDIVRPEDPKTPTYALLARITTLTQHFLTAPTPKLRKSLLDLLATVAPALAPDENAFLPLVNAVWPVVITRLYDGEPYVVIAACHALSALCASAGDFLTTRIKAEWHANLSKWCLRAKADAVSKVSGAARNSTKSGGSNIASRSVADMLPSIVRMPSGPATREVFDKDSNFSGTTTDVLLPGRPAAASSSGEEPNSQLLQISSSVPSVGGAAAGALSLSVGLGRFSQAVQIWEAVAGLLTAIVSYVKLDDDVYDVILDLLLAPATSGSSNTGQSLRLLPASEEQKARKALSVINADAVWLADYRTGLASDVDGTWWKEWQPVLASAQFASVD